MKFIFSYLEHFFEPEEFKLSEEEIQRLKKENVNKENFLEVKEISNYETHLNLLLSIYDEAKFKTGVVAFKSLIINFKELDCYTYLLEEDTEEKILFLYFLIDEIKKNTSEISRVPEVFKFLLYKSVLKTKLRLTSKNINDFFVLWKLKDPLFLWNHFQILIEKTKQLNAKNKIDAALVKTLESYIFRDVELYRYEEFYKDIELGYRIINDYKYRNEDFPFLLTPDYFGKKVNTFLLNSEKKEGITLSEILQLLSIRTRNKIQNQKLEEAIQNIGIDFFTKTAIHLLNLVINFKSKIEIEILWSYGLKKRVVRKHYFGMFKGNHIVVIGLLKLLVEKNLITKISIDNLITIIKRSYTLKEDVRLSKISSKLGDLCVGIIAANYGIKGKEKINELYNDISCKHDKIPYKKVRKTIDNILNDVSK